MGGGPGYETGADLSRNEFLHAYLLVFVCASQTTGQARWYFSTATSLEKQDWTTPQLVVNSASA